MSILDDLPSHEAVFPFVRKEVLEARVRCIYKRSLRKRGVFFMNDWSTEELKRLYYWPRHCLSPVYDERTKFRKWLAVEWFKNGWLGLECAALLLFKRPSMLVAKDGKSFAPYNPKDRRLGTH